MIKLIASDMDGTLLNPYQEIDEETIRAIKRAHKNNIIFSISTGREYGNVKPYLEKNGIECQCVLMNGAEYRNEKGEITASINIKKNPLKKIIKVLKENKVPARIFAPEGVYSTSSKEEAFKEIIARTQTLTKDMSYEAAAEEAAKSKYFLNIKYTDNIDEIIENKEVRKIVAFNSDLKLLDKIKEELSCINDISVVTSFENNFEVTDIDAQKGKILEKVILKMGLKKEEVMIFGDSTNDASMFEIFPESVAMGNAIPEIKKIAKYITEPNTEAGVAKTINRIIEGKLDEVLRKN